MARLRANYSGERRTEHFGFQLTPSEKTELERRATEQGMLPAEFVRASLSLGGPPVADAGMRRDPATRELVGALGRIGNNINQLAHHANETGRLGEAALLAQVIEELKAALRRIL
jgi:hypothetical protein